MTDRANQPAVLRRRAERAEAHLALEKEAHSRTFLNYRGAMHELVDYKLRHKAVLAALAGDTHD